MVPVLHGFDSKVTPGAVQFAQLDAGTQIKILGPAKWAAWKDGKVTLDENAMTGIVGRRMDPIWGSMRYERSLAGILGKAPAKSYTRLALMGLAKEQLSADELIKVAGLGLRELKPGELDRVIRHVAAAGFDPNGLERAGGRLAGFEWNGEILKGSSMMPPGVAHYLRHAVVGREWPDGTSIEGYFESLRNIIVDKTSGIIVHKIGNEWQIGFINQSGKWQGIEGGDIIFVEYRVSTAHWVTGYQPKDIDKIFSDPKWSELRWIRRRT